VLLMLCLLLAITISAVTRFVDFSNSPSTWIHAQTTQGHRAYYTPERLGPLPPAIAVLVIRSQVLAAEPELFLHAFQHNLYKRPPPSL